MRFASPGVRGRLWILLAMPLVAVVGVSVPFTVGRVDDAISAQSTVTVAQRARASAGLLQDLQQERLLTLTYLVSPDADREEMRIAVATVSDRADQVLAELKSPGDDALIASINDLRRLDTVRSAALERSGSPVEVDRIYHQIVMGLIGSLGLTTYSRADASGLGQLRTLDALLRINEDITRLGAALVIGTKDSVAAGQLVTETLLITERDIEQFHMDAKGAESALLAVVVQGQTAQKINEYARQITVGGLWVSATKALTAAEATLVLTRLLQERLARDIAGRADDRATDARTGAGLVIGLVLFLVACVTLLGAVVTRSISRPLRRLTSAAGAVADLARAELVRVADSEVEESTPPRLVAVRVATSDEIGELATAFNRVQTTAALMMEQQFATRRNVSTMFANIAKRNRSLIARQLTLIEDLESHGRDGQPQDGLRRLDHLTERLHRSAESLLVVAGSREQGDMSGPTPLVDILRSVIGEIEGTQAVALGPVCDATIAPQLVADLRLIFAELLENAIAFSPQDAPVLITAEADRSMRIAVVDAGMGMPGARIAEENRRLIERERLDIVPTSTFGLFVVGRLARRHGLRVTLAPNRGLGITVEIAIPTELFVLAPTRHPVQLDAAATPVPRYRSMLQLPRYPDPTVVQQLPQVPEVPVLEGSFPWFDEPEDGGPDVDTPVDLAPPPEYPMPQAHAQRAIRDASAERDALESFFDGFARAATGAADPAQTIHPDESEQQ